MKKNRKMITTIFEDPTLAKDIFGPLFANEISISQQEARFCPESQGDSRQFFCLWKKFPQVKFFFKHFSARSNSAQKDPEDSGHALLLGKNSRK